MICPKASCDTRQFSPFEFCGSRGRRVAVFRYIAWVWDSENAEANSAAALFAAKLDADPAWAAVFRQKGVAVYCAGRRAGSSEAYTLASGAGVILGKLFERGDGHSVASPLQVGERETHRIMIRQGRLLIDRYWGRYVAFLHDATMGKTWVIRDPSAALPCFAVQSRGAEIYGSQIDDLRSLGLEEWSINWRYIRAALTYTRLELNQTGINEVTQVLGGECVEWTKDKTQRTFYWNPLSPRSEVPNDPMQAAAMLRSRVKDCVRAWGSSYPAVMHTLSGGLDSSIVLTCLRENEPKANVTCLNYYSAGADTDERRYARVVAEHSDAELVELERDPTVPLDPMLRVHRAPSPSNYVYSIECSRSEADLCAQKGASAMFSGFGGDQLFYLDHAALCAVDY